MMKFRIFHDKNSEDVVSSVKEALKDVFGIETTEVIHFEAVEVEGAYHANRRQYDASNLLNYLIRSKARLKDLCLWIVSDDLYVKGMNFVFGVAQPGKAAVLSTHRLNSFELIKKEAVHEMGHVFGLQHCTNYCVMQFSNSLSEAKKKPDKLCEKCKKLLKIFRTY
jgi:archaemetzincin